MKFAVAVAVLFAGLIAAAPARAVDGLAPGSLSPPPEAAPTVPESPAVDASDNASDNAADSAPDALARIPTGCANCPPPRKYDSQEIVKTRHDLHHTIKTVNTYEIAHEKPVRHGGIRIRSDVTLVNFVVHRYRVIEAPALVDASEAGEYSRPAVYRPAKRCKYSRYGHCRPVLRVHG